MRIGAGLDQLACQRLAAGAVVRLALHIAFPQPDPEERAQFWLDRWFQLFECQTQTFPHAVQPAHPGHSSEHLGRVQTLPALPRNQPGFLQGVQNGREAQRILVMLIQAVAKVHQRGGMKDRVA